MNLYDLNIKVDRILIGCRMLADDNYNLNMKILDIQKENRELKRKLLEVISKYSHIKNKKSFVK